MHETLIEMSTRENIPIYKVWDEDEDALRCMGLVGQTFGESEYVIVLHTNHFEHNR